MPVYRDLVFVLLLSFLRFSQVKQFISPRIGGLVLFLLQTCSVAFVNLIRDLLRTFMAIDDSFMST